MAVKYYHGHQSSCINMVLSKFCSLNIILWDWKYLWLCRKFFCKMQTCLLGATVLFKGCKYIKLYWMNQCAVRAPPCCSQDIFFCHLKVYFCMVAFILFFWYCTMLYMYADFIYRPERWQHRKHSHMNWLKYCTIRGDWETSKLNKSKFMHN